MQGGRHATQAASAAPTCGHKRAGAVSLRMAADATDVTLTEFPATGGAVPLVGARLRGSAQPSERPSAIDSGFDHLRSARRWADLSRIWCGSGPRRSDAACRSHCPIGQSHLPDRSVRFATDEYLHSSRLESQQRQVVVRSEQGGG